MGISMPQEPIWDRSNESGSICFSCRKLTICSSIYVPWLGIYYWVIWQIPEQSWNGTLEIGKESLALFASSDVSLLLETKKFLSSKFDMKDLGEASFVLGIEIYRDRSKGVLGLSQKAYIERMLKKFSMHKYSPSPAEGSRWRLEGGWIVISKI